MNRAMFWLKKITIRISMVGNWFGMGVLLLMMLLIVSNIVTRLLGTVITPTYELSELMAAVGISFCIVYATMEKGHIVVDILLARLPQRIQSYFQIFTLVLGLGTWVWISFASIIFANRQWRLGEKTELLDIPIAPIRYIWIIALVVLCLLILIQIIEAISEVSNKWNRL